MTSFASQVRPLDVDESSHRVLDDDEQHMVHLALGQNRILELIAAGSPLNQTMDELLRFLEQDAPGMLCSILLFDKDKAVVRICSAPSLPAAYSRAIDGAPIGPVAGSCGTAIYRREPVIVADIETDPLWAPYRELAHEHDLRACWSTPILSAEGAVLGSFAMYFREPRRPEPQHERIVSLAIHVAALAIGKERHDNAIHESEERYRLLNLATKDAVWDWDVNKNTLWWNEGVQTLFGYAAEEVTSEFSWWVEHVHPDDRDRVDLSLTTAATDGSTSWYEEYRFLRRDGEYAEVQDRGYVLRDALGRTIRMIGMMQDISERKRSENRIRRLNRTHEVLSGINSAIVRIRERDQLLQEACRISVEQGQFAGAWIARYDLATSMMITLAFRGDELTEGTLRELNRLDTDTAGRVTVGRALREGKPIWCNDVAEEDRGGLGNLRSMVALPVFLGKSAMGVLVLYTREKDFFDDDEVKLLSELTDDIAFALTYMDKEEQIRDLAYHEPLTRLPNRTALQAQLDEAIHKAATSKQSLALLLMNLDHFRDINDTLGHQNGDLLLQHVADELRVRFADTAKVAALGGDEFAILLPHVSGAADVERALSRIRESLMAPVQLAGIPIRVEGTLGIALYPEHGRTLDLLWRHADVALRTAKERHEPQLFYSAVIDHYDPARLALIGELSAAIAGDQLRLHYQPKIDLRTGRTIGVEALVRWQHKTRGLIYPDTFIPLAERTGLIDPLTSTVVALALADGVALDQRGFALGVSVNLSARNLHDPTFCKDLLERVRAARFPLSRLTLEITETAIMSDPGRAKEALQELRDAGIHLSMDDFGIGQSSLTYLKDLPMSKMKIDKSFVMDFKNPRNTAIVRSAIDLAQNLGLQVTAEGVEDEATCNALRDLSCDVGQGYFFSKPKPLDQIEAWFSESPWGCQRRSALGLTGV